MILNPDHAGATAWTVATKLLCAWNSPGKNTGTGSHSLLQGIFLTQGWNLGLLHCRWILYQLSYQGNHLALMPIHFIKVTEQRLLVFFNKTFVNYTCVNHTPHY